MNVVVGAYARIDPLRRDWLCGQLSDCSGVSPFDLETQDLLGLIVEAESVDIAHQILREDIGSLEAVQGVFPISVQWDDEPSDDPREVSRQPKE